MIDDTEKKGSKNMSENRDFKGVWIPKEVWLDTRLNALDKVILMEIDSLDQGEKGCYASNEHLAEFCQWYQQQFQNLLNVDMYTFKILMEESEN